MSIDWLFLGLKQCLNAYCYNNNSGLRVRVWDTVATMIKQQMMSIG